MAYQLNKRISSIKTKEDAIKNEIELYGRELTEAEKNIFAHDFLDNEDKIRKMSEILAVVIQAEGTIKKAEENEEEPITDQEKQNITYLRGFKSNNPKIVEIINQKKDNRITIACQKLGKIVADAGREKLKKNVKTVASLTQNVNIFQKETRLNKAKREMKEKEFLAISEKELEEYYSLTVRDTKEREKFLNDKLKEIENLKVKIQNNADKWDDAYDNKENNHRVYQILLGASELKIKIKEGLNEFSDNEKCFEEKLKTSREKIENNIKELKLYDETNWEKQKELEIKTKQLKKLKNLEKKWQNEQESHVKQITEKFNELDRRAKAEKEKSDNFFKENILKNLTMKKS